MKPCIFLNIQWLRIMVSLRRIECSGFMSILTRWTHLTIKCIIALHQYYSRQAAYRVWLSLHPIFSTYPLLGAYLLTIYTYKCMHLLTRVYHTGHYIRLLFCLGSVTNLLGVTPSNPLSHPLSPPPIPLCAFKFKDLVAKQHPTINDTYHM